MLTVSPTAPELTALLGPALYTIWEKLCLVIDEQYDMEHLWNTPGKPWTYQYKFRRGGKTLCTLCAKENGIGFLLIFGQAEREKFEKERTQYAASIQKIYEEAATYHDGKWMMFAPTDSSMLEDFIKLLAIKRKPNKK